MALAFDRPQLEGERGAQRVCGRNHARAGQLGVASERVAIETDQIGDEQKQSSDPCGELARAEHEAADIGHGLGGGSDQCRALRVEAAWQRSKTLAGQDFPHRRGAQRHSLLPERPTDVVDRVVALAQRHDLLAGEVLFGLLARPRSRHGEEIRQYTAAKVVAEHTECGWRISKPARHLC